MTRTHISAMDVTSVIMLLLLAVVWGGTFFFAEIALRQVPPLTIVLHRVVWAVPVLALILRRKGIAVPRSWRVWRAYLVMGALNNALPFSLIFWGQTQIEGGLASILNATTALFGAVVAGLLLRDEPLTARKLAGAGLGLLGVAFIMGPDALSTFNPGNLAQLAVLAATLCYALAGVWGRVALSDQPPLMNACGMLVGSAVLMIPVALWVEGVPRLQLSPDIWAALLAMAVLSTALAYLLYFAILARAGAANLLLVTLLIPPVAIGLGVFFLSERMPAGAWIGFAIIAAGFVVTDGRLLARLGRVASIPGYAGR